jgi:formamidopyrimidine-DNA glycosylase
MPELAECAIYAQDINKYAGRRKIIGISYGKDAKWSKKIVPNAVRKEIDAMLGQPLVVSSHAKTVFIGDHVAVKLGMTGRFTNVRPEPEHEKHVFLDFWLADGLRVWYLDYRRFGRLSIATDTDLGTEALGGYTEQRGFHFATTANLQHAVEKKLKGYTRVPRIAWLLNYGSKTGVGNYLANEALGRLELDPFKPGKDNEEAVALLQKCLNLAYDSFNVGGNSFAGGYFRLNGQAGQFEKYCRFYRSADVPRFVFRGRPVYTHFKLSVGSHV